MSKKDEKTFWVSINCKARPNTQEEEFLSEKLQNAVFDAGYTWHGGETTVLYTESKGLGMGELDSGKLSMCRTIMKPSYEFRGYKKLSVEEWFEFFKNNPNPNSIVH